MVKDSTIRLGNIAISTPFQGMPMIALTPSSATIMWAAVAIVIRL